MALKEDIQSLTEFEKELRDAYLNRLIDFLKYTSAIALATSLWIGTNFSKYVESINSPVIDKQSSINPSISNSSITDSSGIFEPIRPIIEPISHFLATTNPVMVILSFGFVLMSLFVAVVIFYVILGMWELEWKYIGMMNPVIDLFNTNRDKNTLSDEEFSKKINEVKSFHFKYENIETVKTMFKIHVIFLITGIFCFFISILFQ